MLNPEVLSSEFEAGTQILRFRDGFWAGIKEELHYVFNRGRYSPAFEIEREYALLGYRACLELLNEAKARGENVMERKELRNLYHNQIILRQRDLKRLNQQLGERRLIEVQSDLAGNHSIETCILDLHPENTNRIPHFLIGGIDSGIGHTSVLGGALAMLGEKVIMMAYPEQRSCIRPPDWARRLLQADNFSLHASVLTEVMRTFGDKFNLWGFSMGGGIALWAAAMMDTGMINNLTVLDPVGLTQKSLPRIGVDFFVIQGLRGMMDPATRAKSFHQTSGEKVDLHLFLLGAEILRKQQIDVEMLSQIRPEGEFRMVLGVNSPLIKEQSIVQMLSESEDLRTGRGEGSPLKLFRLHGADHMFPLTYSMGLARVLQMHQYENQVVDLNINTLERSVAQRVYGEIVAEYKRLHH